jgi:TonB family protein
MKGGAMLKWMLSAAGAYAMAAATAALAQGDEVTAAGTREDPILVTRVGPGASEPVPATNPGTWVTTDDYPSWALRYEVDGVVRFSLDVDSEGRVTGCEIVGSSGVPELDEIACAKMSERASFRPARDDKGNAVAAKWASSVRWQIPRNERAFLPPPGALVTSMTIEPDGSVSHCEIEQAEGAGELGGPFSCDENRHYEPILNAEGNPQRTRVRTTIRFEHEALPDK